MRKARIIFASAVVGFIAMGTTGIYEAVVATVALMFLILWHGDLLIRPRA